MSSPLDGLITPSTVTVNINQSDLMGVRGCGNNHTEYFFASIHRKNQNQLHSAYC